MLMTTFSAYWLAIGFAAFMRDFIRAGGCEGCVSMWGDQSPLVLMWAFWGYVLFGPFGFVFSVLL